MICDVFSFQEFLAVRILPVEVSEPRSFHLALLLDTSGSMEGKRLEALQRTLHILVDHLKPTDRLTLIEYNNEATVIAEAESDPVRLHAVVDGLTAHGGTCMEAAILQLVVLARREGYPPLQAAFLMTDGYVNAGIRSLGGLGQLLESLPANVPVNTLGFGEHQAELLQGLAVPSRGSYAFAEAGEMLPTVIGNIVGGLAEESAVGVTIHLPDAVTCMEVGKTVAGKYLVGNLVGGKEQWIVFSGQCDSLRISWVGGDAVVPVLSASEEDMPIVREQWFRARAVKLFLDARCHKASLGDISLFEQELDTSGLMERPLMMRLKAQLFEVIESLKTYQTPRPVESRTVSRLLSNLTTFGLQRGVFVPPESHVADPVDMFASPTQRQVSQHLTEMYTQRVDCQDPM